MFVGVTHHKNDRIKTLFEGNGTSFQNFRTIERGSKNFPSLIDCSIKRKLRTINPQSEPWLNR